MRSTIQTAVQICSLPAVPTHDWATRAASTLTTLSPSLVTSVLIANLNESTSSINLISAGVSTQTTNNPEHASDTLFLLDKLERLTGLGIPLPQGTIQRGLVSPLATLQTNWQSSPFGRIFAAQGLQNPILAVVPITHEHPGFVLICTLATDSSHPTTAQPYTVEELTDAMAQLVPVLSEKTHFALEQVTNPKAWLTDREKTILDQLILGSSVRTIADNLDRSTHTVHDHVKNLHKKLGATSRGQLIAKALGHPASSADQQVTAPNPMVLLDRSPLPELKPTGLHAQRLASQPHSPKPQARPMRQQSTSN